MLPLDSRQTPGRWLEALHRAHNNSNNNTCIYQFTRSMHLGEVKVPPKSIHEMLFMCATRAKYWRECSALNSSNLEVKTWLHFPQVWPKTTGNSRENRKLHQIKWSANVRTQFVYMHACAVERSKGNGTRSLPNRHKHSLKDRKTTQQLALQSTLGLVLGLFYKKTISEPGLWLQFTLAPSAKYTPYYFRSNSARRKQSQHIPYFYEQLQLRGPITIALSSRAH